MYRRVVAEADHHFRAEDVLNLDKFPQEGAEQTTRDWLGTLRYRGFPVVKDSANQVTVSIGAAYIDYRQFYLGAPQQVSITDEKPLLAGQKRVVILCAQGSPDVPAAAVTRDVTVEVPDGAGGSTIQDTTQSVVPWLENRVLVAKVAGGLSTQEAAWSLMAAKARLEADGIEVVGPTDHTIFKSIYFFDPSGHRLELAADTATPQMNKALDDVKWDMLNEWDRTKKAPQHARWMHDGSGKVGAH